MSVGCALCVILYILIGAEIGVHVVTIGQNEYFFIKSFGIFVKSKQKEYICTNYIQYIV